MESIFSAKRVKVQATFDGVPYHGSIVSMSGCMMIGVPKEIRDEINKIFNKEVVVTVKKDEEHRSVAFHEDFFKRARA